MEARERENMGSEEESKIGIRKVKIKKGKRTKEKQRRENETVREELGKISGAGRRV